MIFLTPARTRRSRICHPWRPAITYRRRGGVDRLANALVSCGLQPGDRMAILSKNSIEYMLLYFAASKAGLVTIPLNYRLAAAEWSYILNDAGAKILLAAGDYLGDVETIRSELKTIEQFIAVDALDMPGWEMYQNFIADQPDTPASRIVAPEDDLFQLYTSGTTGHPKGAVLTHQAVTTHILQMGLAHNIQPGERLLLSFACVPVAALNAGAFLVWGCLYIQTEFQTR
jgi:acyl-CoA synthetase (AMP-forming)/AMP-acid ligase II